MVTEKARIVAIENDALWVETIQSSTCGACVAKKGCGQSLLSKVGIKASYLRVLLEGRSPSQYAIDDSVSIGIPNDVVVKSSLFAYLLPLLLLLGFSGAGNAIFNHELYSIGFGLVGLVMGGAFIQWFSYVQRDNKHYQPTLLETKSSSDYASSELNETLVVIKQE